MLVRSAHTVLDSTLAGSAAFAQRAPVASTGTFDFLQYGERWRDTFPSQLDTDWCRRPSRSRQHQQERAGPSIKNCPEVDLDLPARSSINPNYPQAPVS